MKNISLRKKLIVWYSLFFALLIFLNVFIVLIVSDPITSSRAKNEIKDVAEDVAETLSIVSGIAYYDYEDNERFIYFEDGIAFVLYFEGNFFEGQYPANLPDDFAIQPYTIQRFESQTAVWYIYDLPIQDGFTLRAFYNDRGGIEAYGDFLNILLIIAPILLIASTLGGLLIIKNALKPVEAMAETASKIKKDNDFKRRLDLPNTHDEINTLAVTINEMLDKVETSFQREKDFSSNVSHELRTPLTVLKAQLEYLESKMDLNTYSKEFDSMNQQIFWLEKIITQMLELTRLSSETKIEQETFLIEPTMDSILKGFEEAILDKQLNIHLEIVPPLKEMTTSLTFFMRSMNNLISNAIKFSYEKGTIEIKIEEEKDFVKCIIKDDGFGISDKDLLRIFDALYQVESSRSNHPLSLGVGLTLTKEMMEILHGAILVESKEGEGSMFTLRFPKR